MVRPRFTFCIPNLNKIDYLPACIDSMLAQDCDDWQCVFVDGFSTDGCWEYMQRFAGDPRFRVLRGLKQGMYADWNECLQHVDTEYFYILTSDDTCYPGLVRQTTQVLDQYLDIDVCHFQYELIDEDGQVLASSEECTRNRCPIYSAVNCHAHRRSGICEAILHYAYGALYTTLTSLVFRRRLLSKVEGFSSEYGSVADFDWTMRLGLFTDIIYIPLLLATWRIYPKQATNQTSDELSAENYFKIAQKNINILKSAYATTSEQVVLDGEKLIAQLKDHYIGRAIDSAQEARNFLRLLQVFRIDASYPLRKLLRRVSGNRIFPYDTQKFAYGLIETYRLQWPPQPIDLAALSQNDLEVVR